MCESFFTDNKILIFRGNMASFLCPSGEEIGDLSKLVRISYHHISIIFPVFFRLMVSMTVAAAQMKMDGK